MIEDPPVARATRSRAKPRAPQLPIPPAWRGPDGFRRFLVKAWDHLKTGRAPTPVQCDIADFIAGGPRKLCVLAFRGVGKTYITVAYAAWCLLLDPNLKVVIISATGAHASKVSAFLLALFRSMPELQHLAPAFDGKKSIKAFNLHGIHPAAQYSVTSIGIDGQIPGNRADILICDDIEIPLNSATVYKRMELRAKTEDFQNLMRPEGPERIVWLGTPQSFDTIYRTLPQRGYQVYAWPIRYPRRDQISEMKEIIAPSVLERLAAEPSLEWFPTDSQRFPESKIQPREAEGEHNFILQNMLDWRVTEEGRYPLKISSLVVTDLTPHMGPESVLPSSDPLHRWGLEALPSLGHSGDEYYRPAALGALRPYESVVLAVDPAGTGSDEMGWAISGTINGTIFLLDAGGLRGGYTSENLEFLAKKAVQWRANQVIWERNFGGGTFVQVFQPILRRICEAGNWHCGIDDEGVQATAKKEERMIATLEPLAQQRRIVVNRQVIMDDLKDPLEGVPEAKKIEYRLFYQWTHLSRPIETFDPDTRRLVKHYVKLTHDDRLDAVELALSHWAHVASQDQQRRLEREREREAKQELKDFLRDAIVWTPAGQLKPPKRKTWISYASRK